MSDATIVHMHNILEELKTELEEARAIPDSEYISHKELKKRILK